MLITSRKNPQLQHLRALISDAEYRREHGEFVSDGRKLLQEALQNGIDILAVYARQSDKNVDLYPAPVIALSDDLFDYISPMKNSPGPVFTARMSAKVPNSEARHVLVLENIQDPGNVGTLLRSAAAFGVDEIVFVGSCADVYNPKTVRAAMGALYRQHFCHLTLQELKNYLVSCGLPLYGAALQEESVPVENVCLQNAAVAVGNEGNGLTEELLSLCDKKIILPMTPGSESLNAAVAGSILMWEMMK